MSFLSGYKPFSYHILVLFLFLADTLSCEIQKGSELEYPSQYLEYAAALLALGRNKDWGTDYELEKAYWFDISPTNVSSILFENKTSCISNEIGVQTKKKVKESLRKLKNIRTMLLATNPSMFSRSYQKTLRSAYSKC